MYSQVHNELAEMPFSTMPDTTPMLGIEHSRSDAVPTVVLPVIKKTCQTDFTLLSKVLKTP